MEFWGVEVKAGETVKVPQEPDACIHLSQAALGEAKKDKASEPVLLYLKFGDQKLVLGTLNRDNIPQIPFDIVLQDKFELSHTSKNASVYFCGYKALGADDDDEEGDEHSDEYPDSEDDPYDISLMKEFDGTFKKKPEDTKADESKKPAEPKKPIGKGSASEKQVKVVEPPKDEEDSDDDDDDDEDELGSSDDEMDADSDGDEESEGDDDEETPPKKGKKRALASALKSPVSNKKAKNATPDKTDGKKGGHVATPHPMKKGGKTPSNEAKDQTPKSGGQFSCNSCKKSFNSEGGLQQHNKAKHQ